MGHVQPVIGFGAGAGEGVADINVLEEEEAVLELAVDRGGMIFVFLVADSVTRRLTCRASGRIPREDVAGLFVDEKEDELSGLIGFWGLTTPPPFPVGFAGVAGI